MILIFLLLTIAGLKTASANDDTSPETAPIEVPEEPDMCVGCDDEEEEKVAPPPQLTLEIIIDPVTGEMQYVIRGLSLE